VARTVVYTCDQCGAKRGATNHWFSVSVVDGEFHTYPLRELIESEHICSPACLTNRLSKWVEETRAAAETTPS
jgi:hypothetical protein